ncbi:MAG: glycosyltransferase family 39 protein [Anaerolinea sp.]|nr:glycosyltransferase family 39 protein [Anaerolinea sp.]
MNEKRILTLILVLFVLLGSAYALITPVFEASDELWHYPMIKHLADGNPLPVQVFDPAQAGPWKQEASQPPLYYYLGAALTFWIDTSDMAQVRWLNPHVDNGVITVDGNTNLAIHDPAQNPWQGTLLAVRIVRLFSVLLGAATVYLTYLIAKEVAPGRPDIALGATAVTAFTPMFLFISGAVNNDNLAIPLASLGVLLLIRGVRITDHRSPITDHRLPFTGYCLLVGVVIGLAILTKQGTFALLPLAWGTSFVRELRNAECGSPITDYRLPITDYRLRLGRALLMSLAYFGALLLPVALIAGWWYWRNIQLYGDFLGWNAFIAVLGSRAQPASLAQLWDERWGFMLAYWGLFGGVNVPMATWIYHVLNGVVVTAVVGFFIYLGQLVQGWREAVDWRFNLPSLINNLLFLVTRHFALLVCLLLAGAVIFGLVQWATTTWSSQGRLVFTALSALSVLLLVGLVGWLPLRLGRWVAGALGGFLLLVAALTPWLWIRPAYTPAAYAPPRDLPMTPVDARFGEALWLQSYAVAPANGAELYPGEYVDVTLHWQVLTTLDRDWSVFVHLHDPVLAAPIAQRDMYFGQGLRPTRLLQPGETLTTFYRIAVPETAVAPADLVVMVGLYDWQTGERMQTDLQADHVALQQVSLLPAPGDYPNATAVNFMNELQLVGYALNPRRAQPGEAVTVTLYVQARRPLTTDYTFSAQIVNLEANERWGSQDVYQPTSTWVPGETQTLEMQLVLADDTPPQVYPLIFVVYHIVEDGSLQKLQLVTADGRITQDDFLLLTKVRIE